MRYLYISIVVFFLFSCESKINKTPKDPQPTRMFTKLSPSKTGLKFSNVLKEDINSTNNIFFFEYYYHGGGVAIGDINNDGLADVFLTSNSTANKLFLNKGNMIFEDITKKSGLNVRKYWSTGAVMVDINNDNLLDIYVCQAGANFSDKSKRRNSLYINKGNGVFSEEAKKYGLNDDNLSTQASFFDYDKDGDLDCFVINESEYFRTDYQKIKENILPFKNRLKKQSCKFFENRNGKFIDITEKSRLLDYSFGLGVVTADINDDGWVDIYVANDYSVPDFLYINQKDGTFKESIKEYTKHTSWFSMGVDFNDFNNDGKGDLAVVDMSSPDHFRSKVFMASMDVKNYNYNINELNRQPGFMFNSLQLSNGNNTFSDIASMAGVFQSEWSWGNLLADFDNDGRKDYFIATGNRRNYQHNDIRKKIREMKRTIKNPVGHPKLVEVYKSLSETKTVNKIYKNSGDLKFNDVTKEWGLDFKTFSNGAAYADLDNDGDLDLVVNNLDAQVTLLRNNSNFILDNNFLKFKFPKSAKGYNGKVKLYMDNGEILMQEYMPTRGFCSSVEHTLHFGIGENKIIQKVEVIWPSGLVEIKENVGANQVIVLKEGEWVKSSVLKNKSSVFQAIDPVEIGLNYNHIENEFDDYKKQILLPYKHSTAGPAITKGDYNQDGIQDIFIGGEKGQISQLWFQNDNGMFQKQDISYFDIDSLSEVVDAISFDFDNDSDLDILVVNGGYEFDINDKRLADCLYINNGKGVFSKAPPIVFPNYYYNGSKVAFSDVDKDGDLDIFIGGRVVPGQYPRAEQSYFLRNNKGKFTKDSTFINTENLGIVRDTKWGDINSDGFPELITVGDWENVKVFFNTEKKLVENKESIVQDYKGWWSALELFDIDNDGDLDFLVGNVGENTKFKANGDKILNVHANDFDGNGTYDIVLSKTYKNKEVPVRGLQCLSDQVPSVKSKFTNYVDFANADLNEILGNDKLKNDLRKTLNFVSSGVYLNENGKFNFHLFPNLAQISPINKFIIEDVNKDGQKDIIIGGNMFDTEVETPRWDAGNGLVLLNSSKKDSLILKPLSIEESGFYAPNNLRDMTVVTCSDSTKKLVVLNNNSRIQIFDTPIK